MKPDAYVTLPIIKVLHEDEKTYLIKLYSASAGKVVNALIFKSQVYGIYTQIARPTIVLKFFIKDRGRIQL